jgi:hypothetical protein
MSAIDQGTCFVLDYKVDLSNALHAMYLNLNFWNGLQNR